MEQTIMQALRGDDRPAVTAAARLTVQHLEQRDRALGAIDRAKVELDRLVEIEDLGPKNGRGRGSGSPRAAGVREIAGEVGSLRSKLDRVYV